MAEAKKTIDDVLARADGVTRHNMLTKLLDRTEAQRDLNYYVRDRLQDVAFDQVAKLHLQAAGGEAFLDHLAFDPDLRKRTIEFLKAPCDEQAAKDYAETLRKSAEKIGRSTPIAGVPKFVQEVIADALRNSELYNRKMPGVAAHAAQMLHKNFASAPVEYRTFMMEKVLFPPNQNAFPMDVDPQQYVFDKTLPEGDKYSKYGRSLLWVR